MSDRRHSMSMTFHNFKMDKETVHKNIEEIQGLFNNLALDTWSHRLETIEGGGRTLFDV
jgi:hypothetical protein